MLCPKCQNTITDKALFCCFCGIKQSGDAIRFKRDHGTGTISIDLRNKNRYIVRAPVSPYGGVRKYLGSYPTHESAEKALTDYLNKGRPDLFSATVGDIYSMWSAAHFRQVSKKTADCYRSLWKHFSPIASMRMTEVRIAHFQHLVNEHGGTGVACGIRTLAKALCRFAIENDLLDKNYAEFVQLPKTEKVEKQTFTAEQTAILWRHTRDRNVQAILVMIYMGFRIGEMTTLTTESVDLVGGYITGGIKTVAGRNRTVPFPANIPEIQQFVAEWVRNAPLNGRLFNMTEHTFRTKVFYETLIKLGMLDAEIDHKGTVIFHSENHLTPHCTRHTFASLSVAAGMQPERLQRIIGHVSFRTTADYYVHVDRGALISEMSKLVRNCP